MADIQTVEGVNAITEANEKYAQSAEHVTEAANNAGISTEHLGNSAINTARGVSSLNSVISICKNGFEQINDKLKEQVQYLEQNQNITEKTTLQFSLMTNAVLGTKKAYDNLFSSSAQINTFEKQITGFLDEVLAGNKNAIASLDDVAKTFTGMVVPDKFKNDIKGAVGWIKEQAIAATVGADNALKLQSGMMELGAATGTLNKVMSAAGPNFENMNNLTAAHELLIANSAAATHKTADEVRTYYAELGKIPNALTEVITSSSDGSSTISMLAGTIRYAIGSGRDYKDVVADLGVAFKTMGMTGQPALEFSSRISQLSNKFAIELSDVKSALHAATQELRNFGSENLNNGKIIEGSVRMMNNYIQALKSTGLSGQSAINVVKEMHTNISKLDIAQRAFLSAQSGGPGGLRGAFKIENLMREGKIDEVMNMVQKTMQKQFGKIITSDEAMSSERAASQAIMQRKMLTEGPLKLVQDEQSAARLLEAFSKKQSGQITSEELQSELQGTMDQGLKFQELSATHLGVLRRIAEEQRALAGVSTLTGFQNIFTARQGSTAFSEGKTEQEIARENNLKRTAILGANQSSKEALLLDKGGPNVLENTTGKGMIGSVLPKMQLFLSGANDTVAGATNFLKRVATDDNVRKQLEYEKNAAEKRIEIAKKSAALLPEGENKNKLIDQIQKDDRIKQTAANYLEIAKNNRELNKSSMQEATQVNVARSKEDNQQEQQLSGRTGNQVTANKATSHQIDVHVTGYCLNCSKPIKEGQHSKIINPPGQ